MSAVLQNNIQLNLSRCLPTDNKSNASIYQIWVKRINLWIARSNQRKQLAKLDSRMLADIGYSHEQVAIEVAKPFWK